MKHIYQKVTNKILVSLREGVAPWQKTWVAKGRAGIPRNYESNRPYSGVNVLLIWLHMLDKGLSDTRYLTRRQINELGGNFKGQSPARIMFYTTRNKMVTDEHGAESEESYPVLKEYNVWNAEQVQGVELEPEETPKPFEFALTEATAFIEDIGATVHHGGGRAVYSRSADRITLPHPADFASENDYLSTSLHEHIHWTAHGTRLDRPFGVKGDVDYAFEELIAELGSAFLCTQLGIEGKLQHASYIDSWISLLEDDARAIFKASTAANKACSYLNDLVAAPVLEEAA